MITKLLSSFAIMVFVTSCTQTVEQRFSAASQYFWDCKYDKAIAIYSSILNSGTPIGYYSPSGPERLSLGSQLAGAYVLNMDGSQAIAVAEQTLQDNPNDVAAMTVLGASQLLVKDPAKAENNLQRAGSLGSWQAYNWLSALYLMKKDLGQAEAVLEDSIDINPTDGWARHWMVVIQCLKGDQDTALKELDVLLRTAGTWDKAAIGKYWEPVDLQYKALVSLTNGDLDGASERARGLIEKNWKGTTWESTGPIWESAGHFLLGVVSLLKNGKSSAMKSFIKAAQGPAGFNPNIWLAALYAYDGDTENLFRAYVAALKSQALSLSSNTNKDVLRQTLMSVLTSMQEAAATNLYQSGYKGF
jgi:tetratricopeptide (TPR) repeat protein